MRKAALGGIVEAHDAALRLLGERVFTKAERKAVVPAELKLSDPGED